MNLIKQASILSLMLLIFTACTANRIQRFQEREEPVSVIVQEDIYYDTPEIVIEPVYIYAPVIVQPEPVNTKTKVRTNIEKDDSQTKSREEGNKNIRNNTGQRNAKSRGN